MLLQNSSAASSKLLVVLNLLNYFILLQDLSAASSEIYTRPRLYLILVLKSILFQN